MDCKGNWSEGEYAVERIIKRRVMSNGKTLYFLKWKNWSEDYNSWEPEEHLHCPGLIEKFLKEERQREWERERGREEEQTSAAMKNGADANNNEPRVSKQQQKYFSKMHLFKIPDVCAFDRGLEAERIVGATDNDGLTFLIKFKGQDKMELVPSKIARYRCPSLVISFFEKHITWHSACDRIKKS